MSFETTGLKNDSEIVSIAIINPAGETLLDQFVKPVRGIPAEATRIHGITEQMVANAPTWADVQPRVVSILAGRDTVVYNATYDRAMLHRSDEAVGLPRTDYHQMTTWYCAMEWYAPIAGEWDEWHDSYRWQRLSTAVQQQQLPVVDAHHALGDYLMTLALIRALVK